MKGHKKCLSIILALMLLFVVSCGDDDDDSPTTPSTPADVAGQWNFTGSITSNDCAWLQIPQLAVGLPGTQGINITQTGSALNGQSTGGTFFGAGWNFTGTATSNTFDLSLVDAVNDTIGSCDYSLGGGMRATNISDNSSPGEVFYAINGLGGPCAGQQCAVMMTGTWTKQ